MASTVRLVMTVREALVRAGVGSRRVVAAALGEKQVAVNGAIAAVNAVLQPGDKVTVRGKPVSVHAAASKAHTTLLLHKPLGVVSTCDDPQARAAGVPPPNAQLAVYLLASCSAAGPCWTWCRARCKKASTPSAGSTCSWAGWV